MKVLFLGLILSISIFGQETFFREVKAQAGDTVSKLAIRYNLEPDAVAKANGLLPNSVLGQGRTIRLPNPVISCDLEILQSPKIRAIRLGMAEDEFWKLFPNTATNTYYVFPNFGRGNNGDFEDVTKVSFDVFEGSLLDLNLSMTIARNFPAYINSPQMFLRI